MPEAGEPVSSEEAPRDAEVDLHPLEQGNEEHVHPIGAHRFEVPQNLQNVQDYGPDLQELCRQPAVPKSSGASSGREGGPGDASRSRALTPRKRGPREAEEQGSPQTGASEFQSIPGSAEGEDETKKSRKTEHDQSFDVEGSEFESASFLGDVPSVEARRAENDN